jgi:hypothetical protein
VTGFQVRTEMQRPRSQLDFGKQGASQTADQVGGCRKRRKLEERQTQGSVVLGALSLP